jgi:alkaline phosphatase D
LDNRFQRTSDNLSEGELSILGNKQIDWLIQNLKYSRAPFKLVAVGGQVLNTAPVYETHAVFGDERKYLIRRIIEEGIEGVVFLSGDKHHSELSRYEDESGMIIYDLTVSPLTAGTHVDDDEKNKLRVPNTLVNERNFGILNFSGERDKSK